MSATEIISEITKLPAAEQKRVLDFLQNRRSKSEGVREEVSYANDKDFDTAADNVLRDRADLLRRLAQ